MSEDIAQRIRTLAQGTCWTVADLDLAWRHMREIKDMSFDRFSSFASDCERIGTSIVPIAQAVQRAVTGTVFIRSGGV